MVSTDRKGKVRSAAKGASAARKPRKRALKSTVALKATSKISAGLAEGKGPKLLAGGNPQIAKAEGNAPVQAYIAAMPGWKSDVGRRLDALITRHVPHVQKAVKWNSPFYGVEGQGWFLSFHTFKHYIKVAFFRGTSLRPIPPGASKSADTRYLDIREGEGLDEAQMATWIKQAAVLPGWAPQAQDPCGNKKPSWPWSKSVAAWFAYESCAVNQIVSNVNLGNVEEQYTRYYRTDAQFNDPSSQVNGRTAIIAHLEESLTKVSIDAIRVKSTAYDILNRTWTVTQEMDTQFLYAVPGTPYVLRIGAPVTLQAATSLRFSDPALDKPNANPALDESHGIEYHRDYFDQLAILKQVPGLQSAIDSVVQPFFFSQVCSQIPCPPPAP